jgi:hypothetical protein
MNRALLLNTITQEYRLLPPQAREISAVSESARDANTSWFSGLAILGDDEEDFHFTLVYEHCRIIPSFCRMEALRMKSPVPISLAG